MKITVTTGSMEKSRTGALAILVFEKERFGPAAARTDRALGGLIEKLISRGDFKPKAGNVTVLYPEGDLAAERLLLVGLGTKKEFSEERLRHAAARSAVQARAAGSRDLTIAVEQTALTPEQTGQAIAEGTILGQYRFLRYKTGTNGDNPAVNLERLAVLAGSRPQAAALERGARTGTVIAHAVLLARDMVNAPSADMTPATIAGIARKLSRKYRLRVRVLDRPQMRSLGMGGLLGVAAGSVQPPKFIVIEYRGGGKKPWIALVGKTITFDSGGISIKPSENMDKMKDDMAGGAAVLGTMAAAAELKLPLNVVGLLPATENMPSGSALKPGDVLTTLAGKTIEIVNTDAEGRLVLADALAYAWRYEPAAIVDIATLTGACRIALGTEAAGMAGTSAAVKEALRVAGEKTGERVWELPLWEGYYDLIKSDIADMKNAGGRDGGVITASCLLSKFVKKYPWAHLDIAAMAWTDKDKPYTPKGATGIGVRLLTQFLRDYPKR